METTSTEIDRITTIPPAPEKTYGELLDEARVRFATVEREAGAPLRPLGTLTRAEAAPALAALAGELAVRGRSDLFAEFERRLSLLGDHAVLTARIVTADERELSDHCTVIESVFFASFAIGQIYLLLADGIEMELRTLAAIAERRTADAREMRVQEELRREAEKAAAEKAERDRIQAERQALWDRVPPAALSALLAAERHPEGSAERDAILRVAEALATPAPKYAPTVGTLSAFADETWKRWAKAGH